MMSHPCARRDAQLLVSRGLSPRRHRRLRNHLRGCDDCQHHYERLRAIEDALTPANVISEAAVERLSELVLEEVAPSPTTSKLAWFGAFGAISALALAAVVVLPHRHDQEFTERGAKAQVASVALNMFVIDPGSGSVARAEVTADGVAHVPSGRVIQLAYSNAAFRYGVVVGVDAGYAVQWYHPGEGDQASGGVHLLQGAVDEPFPGSWSIDASATPLRIFAVFADAPIAPEQIRAGVARLRDSGQPLAAADRLPGITGTQDSLLIEVPGH